MNDTWWGKVIEFFGGELLVNNSWSGSCVTAAMQLFFHRDAVMKGQAVYT